jgi:hypothetical protein
MKITPATGSTRATAHLFPEDLAPLPPVRLQPMGPLPRVDWLEKWDNRQRRFVTVDVTGLLLPPLVKRFLMAGLAAQGKLNRQKLRCGEARGGGMDKLREKGVV